VYDRKRRSRPSLCGLKVKVERGGRARAAMRRLLCCCSISCKKVRPVIFLARVPVQGEALISLTRPAIERQHMPKHINHLSNPIPNFVDRRTTQSLARGPAHMPPSCLRPRRNSTSPHAPRNGRSTRHSRNYRKPPQIIPLLSSFKPKSCWHNPQN
jgi:hypothetical protein